MTGKESSKCWEPGKEAWRGDLGIDIGGGDDASHAPISRCRSGRLERTGIIVRRGGAGDSSRGGFRVARMMFSATQRASRHTRSFRMSSFRMLSSPLPRQQECSGPDAALGRFGCVLLRAVMAGIAGCDRPTLPYDPGVDVGAVRHGAGGEDTVVPVDAMASACQFPATDIASQFLRRRLSARPRLPLRGRRMSASIRGHRSPPSEYARRRFRGCRRPGPARGRSTVKRAWRSNAGRHRSRAGRPAGRRRRTAADRRDGLRPAGHLVGLPNKPSVALPVQSGKTAESENSFERTAGFGIAPSVSRSRRRSDEAEKTLPGPRWALRRLRQAPFFAPILG